METVVIIGGGPAGMMAAIAASQNNKVILIEKNEKLGKKLYITGKGRCNITSSKEISEFFEFIPGNPNFLYSALYTFTNEDTMNFFKRLGVNLKVERGDRVFPESDKSSDIINAFYNELNLRKVDIRLNSNVESFITEEDKIVGIELSNNTKVFGDHFVLCTGGLSYPQTGSTGDGFKFAKIMGHKVITPLPALVPIVTIEDWIKELQGLSLKNVELSIKSSSDKVLYKEFGEMLFTHYGISGPIALSASRVINRNSCTKAVINLKPALTQEELDKRIQRDFSKFTNKAFKNSLDELLPQKLIPIIITLSEIEPDKKVHLITKAERKKLVMLLQNLTLSIKGLRPIAEAIITCGGIDVKSIDASTMKSKTMKNLSFAGEIIDIDAYTGGFNLQLALSTGYLAGIKASSNNIK
ncbi:MAG: NAD(P)/FAD-dependent oxidoreductase [Clostridiaceae bacterium]|nr:NAD(P)/FAD-dependent oxidoreductase [Clostridiaceae bacterium]